MDYYVDQIPIDMSDETRQYLKEAAMFTFKWADWACGTRDIREYIEHHPSFFACEVVMLICSLFTFVHAVRNGGRFVYLWIGIIIHGLMTEIVVYNTGNVDNFWHAQSIAMFFGRRLPVYVMLGLYPLFDYTSTIVAKKLRLPWWAEGPAVGLGAVLLDIPYDIMGVKLLWWTWHDTDPNIYDRMYWVPWTSYYFHASFGCSFVWMYRLAQKICSLKEDEYDWKKFPREIFCAVFAGSAAFWVGAAQFIPVYHIFHDYLKVPTENCVMAFLAFYGFLVWVADRNPKEKARPRKGETNYWFDELGVAVILHYFFFMGIVLLGDPQNITAMGLHEPIGPCNVSMDIQGIISGLKLKKQSYLCPTKYDEPYFDFHCLPNKAPPAMRDGRPVDWYTICGTPYPNHAEYIFVIWFFCLFGLAIFYQALAQSGPLPIPKMVTYSKRRQGQGGKKKDQ